MTDFSKELAIAFFSSTEQYPVDFDDAWQWLGYSSKQAAKKKLTRHFEKEIDYLSRWINVAHSNGLTASQAEVIKLTVEAFKSLGMMAGTDKGKEIRRYFLDCEEELKRIKSEPVTVQPAIASQPTPRDIADFVSVILSITGVDNRMIAASAANHVAKQYPALRPVAEDLKKELVTETPDRLLTPTELGLILEQRTGIKHTPQRVNKLLADNGLQTPNPQGKDPAWLPTPKGSEFSKLLLAAQKGLKDATRQHLQWYEAVLDVLSQANK